jgi:hypothetical protein
MSTTVFNSFGRFEYDDNGQQVIQVYEGDGVPDFKFRYHREISNTEWFFKLLDKEPKTKILNEFVRLIARLKNFIELGYGHEREIVGCVQGLRLLVKTTIAPHDVSHDCRVCACCLDNEWRLATNWSPEE